MKILFINSTCGIGSTGRICTDLALKYEKDGYQSMIAYGRGNVPDNLKRFGIRIGSTADIYTNVLRTRLFDDHGFGTRAATKRFLKWAQDYNPDVLWLHNLHGYYINIELLFEWIKTRPDMQVKWTLHDCWAFTGHCSYFTVADCYKWETGCSDCKQKKDYPTSVLKDNCRKNFIRKRNAFSGVKNMTLITPSQWLADLVMKSFLKQYKIEVHHNTINKNIFKPTQSDFRKRHNLINKKIVLGVANIWDKRKGLDDFIVLSKKLGSDYKIVLIGLDEKQIKTLPDNILGITRTANPAELAEIYTAADVYANPSREETFGMTTYEALACGTPAIVYKGTACEEVANLFGGVAVESNADSLYDEILKLTKD